MKWPFTKRDPADDLRLKATLIQAENARLSAMNDTLAEDVSRLAAELDQERAAKRSLAKQLAEAVTRAEAAEDREMAARYALAGIAATKSKNGTAMRLARQDQEALNA